MGVAGELMVATARLQDQADDTRKREHDAAQHDRDRKKTAQKVRRGGECPCNSWAGAAGDAKGRVQNHGFAQCT